MSEHLFMWPTPLIYLLIVGFERVFWRSRYEQIKKDIRLNLFILTGIVLLANGLIWITDHVMICWK